jgi:tRNA pseudouridine32 synthase/23S rRNA pseudouridine746 synthase
MVPAYFHCFDDATENISLPEKFTCPFHYTPHPLCVKAARQLQTYLDAQTQWQEELAAGKCSVFWWF